jgi:hypothetical protein
MRDAEKGRSWSAQGCDVGIASVEGAAGLTKAFHSTEGSPTGLLSPVSQAWNFHLDLTLI